MAVTRFAFAALMTLPFPAVAQGDWQFTGTFYGWLPGINTVFVTPLGVIEAEVEFSDILDKLDFAFLATVGARNGRLAFVGDLQYFDFGADASPETAAITSVSVDSRATALSSYALYDVSESPNTHIDIGAGLRYFDATFDLDVAGVVPSFPTSEGNWEDAVLSARLTHALNESWSAVAGYRHLMFERDFDGKMVTSDGGGPVIGFQKQF